MPWNPERPGYRLRTVAPSRHGVQVLARAHGHGEVHRQFRLRRIEAHQPGRCRRRSDGAPGAVGVNLRPDLGGAADAGRDFVADDDAFQNCATAGSQVFAHGDGAGGYVDGRMPAAQPAAFVHLQRNAGGGIDHGGPNGLNAVRMPDHGGIARPAHVRGQAGEVGVFVKSTAGGDGSDGIQHDVLGGGYGGRMQVLPAQLGDELGQLVKVILGHDGLRL